jgi:hypothetical protein
MAQQQRESGMKRGRPAMVMTHRRRQVLEKLTLCAMEGDRITLGRLVRECGFYGREDAKRVWRDLRQMRLIPAGADYLHTPAGISEPDMAA